MCFRVLAMKYFLLSLIWCFPMSFCATYVNENGLPPMYRMDNYQQCQRDNGRYCFFDFKITPLDPDSRLWKSVKHYEHDTMKLDRSVLNRMICVPSSVHLEVYGKQLIENELNGANATIDISDVDCKDERSFPLIKIVLWSALSVIIILNAISTLIHYKHINDQNRPKTTTSREWFKVFSIINNAQKLHAGNNSPDFQRLKCIQGLRVFSNVAVILLHTILSLFQVYVDDIEELERGFANPIVFYTTLLGGSAVQVFFMISAFLLTNQIFDIYRRQGQFTLRLCFILIVNRIIRFLPTLLIIMPGIVSIGSKAPLLAKIQTACLKACTENWWYTLLHINYFNFFHKICTPGLWYLSADTLYYVTTIVLLYCVLKYKWNIWKTVGIMGGLIMSRYVAHIYINNHDPQIQLHPRLLKELFKSEVINENYVNPYGNWPSSLIGLLLGYTYNQYKDQKVSISNKLKILWLLTFTCVPPLIVAVFTYSSKGISALIIGPILRPAFAMSVGIGILGMSLGLGGIVKTLLESKTLLLLSNVTYTTYLVHFYIVFAKGFFLEDLLPFKSHDLIFWIIFDLFCSYALGAIYAIFVEYPGMTIQKMYVPQIARNDANKVSNRPAAE